MEFIIWLGVLFLVIPFILGFTKMAFSTLTISDKNVNPIWAFALLAIGAILVLMGFSNLWAGLFSSLKNFCLLLIKWIIGFPILVVGIIKCGMFLYHRKWSQKLITGLNGELGTKIKKYIPGRSSHYWVYEDKIVYEENSHQDYYISFNDLGYENIPAACANAVCEWLLNNIIAKPQDYEMRRIYETEDEYVSGNPDTIKTIETYDGYESHYVKGDSSYRTIETTIGYELIYKPRVEPTPVVKQSLKKW